MKVLLIDVNCKNSSTGKIVYSLYNAINKHGDKAAICYGRGPLIKENNIFKFGLDWETNIHALLTRLTGLTGCYSYFSTRRLIRFIKKFEPDVVHIHELHAYFVNLAPLLNYLKRNNIPTIWTFHCEFMYTGKCGYAYECTRFMDSCGQCPHINDYPKSLFFDCTKRMLAQKKKLLSDYDNLKIVTPSEWLANRVKLSFFKNKDIRVIHNGIDTNVFYPRKTDQLRKKLNLKDGEKVVLSAAPYIMNERKGGKWVLQIAEIMKNEPIRFILVGAEDIEIPHGENVVIFPKITNQDELAEFYSLADLFVICSKRENFPTTCLEAQCCGTPVCGFDSGGSKETSIDSEDNFVKYGDLSMLSKKIVDILLSENNNKKNIRQDKSQNIFKTEAMSKEYNELYF